MATIPSQPLAQAPMSLGPTNSPTSRSLSATFSDPAPYQFTQYYRNGPLVPDNAANSGIPTSGPIALSQFVGATSDPASQTLNYTISATTQNLDLLAYASSPARPAPTRYILGGAATVTYTISPGVYIGSATRTQTAMVTGVNNPTTGWSPTVTLRVINQGIILGAGGAGGISAPPTSTPPIAQVGQSGGTALDAQRALQVQNVGTIAGGGGGGGNTLFWTGPPNPYNPVGTTNLAGGGGGGAGSNAGPNTGGAGGLLYTGPVQNAPGAQAGQPGTWTAGGAGGSGAPSVDGAEPGGDGGGLGQAGQTTPLGGTGGAAGFYAVNNANITWQATGTRQGQVS